MSSYHFLSCKSSNKIKQIQNDCLRIVLNDNKSDYETGQVDFPESPATKFRKSHQILNQTKRNINKVCLGKISRHKTVRIKFSVDSGFSNMLYGKRQKPGNAGNQQKAF